MTSTLLTGKPTIFWFRQDLRIKDNPGLIEAAKNGSVMCIYILDEDAASPFKMGGATRWWLHHSLQNLNEALGQNLNIYVGNAKNILLQLIQQNKIEAVYWNRCYEPWRIKNDTQIKSYLKSINIACKSFNASLLWEPWKVLKSDGTPYKVYTPFYRKALEDILMPRPPLPLPEKFSFLKDTLNQMTIETLSLLPTVKWYTEIENKWQVGEKAAQNRLDDFLDKELLGYKEGRDYPYKANISRLSPHLHFGEISPHQIWHTVKRLELDPTLMADAHHFLREIAWREFSYHLLYHFPDLPRKNFQPKFDHFPWQENSTYLAAWQKGETGYPIVDAGMRELWQTGYMHNRVRMIAASFLVKNLLIHWHHGEDWFWDCLIDADLANNSASWQWVAGSGADAAPYFRIFNPITQGEKFDPEGHYTRRYIPELSKLPNKYLFKPWEAPEFILKAAGITLGKTYPNPIVNLQQSRDQALKAYNILKSGIE